VLRRGTAGTYRNFVISNFVDASFDIDSEATFQQFEAGDLTVDSSLFGNVTPSDAIEVEEGDPVNTSDVLLGDSLSNVVAAPTLGAPARGGRLFVNGSAEAAVPAADLSQISAFFEPVDFVGAVPSQGEDFTEGWTVWLDTEPTGN